MPVEAAGIIVEYNPFHNGHYYHLQKTKEITKADCLIAVMSGNFLQRGEPALVSKWVRTKMALEAGVDIVVELPYAFATQHAEIFASGAISILHSLYCKQICFGSESGNIDDFTQALFFLEKHEQSYHALVRSFLKKGMSYPKALATAYQQLQPQHIQLDLGKPNNILGFYYVKAIKQLHSHMKPSTIQRTSAQYHDEQFTSNHIASATSIRKSVFENKGNLSPIKPYVPKATYQLLQEYIQQYHTFHRWEDYFSLLKYKILTSTPAELQNIYEIEEGIEYRIIDTIREATSFHEFMAKLKTKRYTWTRLQRMCVHILTNTTKEQMAKIPEKNISPYIRLLGMSKKGQEYIRKVKKKLEIPLIAKLSSFHDELLFLDIKAAQTYSFIFPEPLRTKMMKGEYATPPIRFGEHSKK
jgi:predicted nucleotidyltransferase